MRTLDEILRDGIKDEDWTYCKPEYAPHEGCKIGMPEEFTPDGTKKDDVETCYILTGKFRNGETLTNTEFMYLSDGKFYWHDNLWDENDTVDQEKDGEYFVEPIAWIPYRYIPDQDITFPIAPHKAENVPTPPWPDNATVVEGKKQGGKIKVRWNTRLLME